MLRKLKPALEQLIERKFLAAYAIVKKGKYTRLNLRKASAVQQKKSIQRVQTLTRVRQQYNTTSREQELWQQVSAKLQPNLTAAKQAMVANLILLSVNGQRAILGAPSTFILQWFEHPKQAALKNDIMATLALYLVKNQVILEFVNLKTVSKSES